MKKLLSLALALIFTAGVLSPVQAQSLIDRVSGYILLQVEQNGEAWFVRPVNGNRYYMKDGGVAYEMMRSFGLGITDTDLAKIPSVNTTDELLASTNTCKTGTVANRVKGRILLQVQQNGEAWYVYPKNCTRIYMKDGNAAYTIMRFVGLGITDDDLQGIPTADGFGVPNGGVTNGNHGEEDPANKVLDDQYDADRVTLLNSINAERAALGLPAMRLNFNLSDAAQSQADDMTLRGYFAFSSPEGKTFDAWVSEAGYTAHSLAENLAQSNQGISTLVNVWKSESQTSYNNVINAEYEELGVGVGEYQGFPIYTVIFARSLEDFFNEKTQALTNISQVRAELLTLVNQERTSRGLSALVIDERLNSAAQFHTDDMLARSFYAHESPEGVTPHERITNAGYIGQLTAENIAKGQFSVQEVMTDWMNSPSHRANILDPEFVDIGFGLSYGENANGLEIIWAQEFGKELN